MTQSASEPSATSSPEPALQAAPPSPGALLRAARERAGLGAEDLAGQLKLAKGTLEALERDDFAALSEPVYVRGYYRKIAKVLPVSESELINAYNARTRPAPVAAQLRRLPLAGGVAAGTSRHSRMPGVGFAVLAVVGIGLLIALATREPTRRLAPPRAAAENAPAAATPAAEPSPAPAAPAGTDTSATTPEPVAAPPATAAPAPAPAVAPAAAGKPNQLALEFSEASFVRVEDGSGRTLKIGLVHGGERSTLDGQPPYTVFLGNAQNVKVFFAGQMVDFSAHINRQNDTARFTVP